MKIQANYFKALRRISISSGFHLFPARNVLVAELISLFEIAIDHETAAILLDLSSQDMEIVVSSLLQKNIILPVHLRNILNFTSEGLKNYVYNNVTNKKELHYKTAKKIKQ